MVPRGTSRCLDRFRVRRWSVQSTPLADELLQAGIVSRAAFGWRGIRGVQIRGCQRSSAPANAPAVSWAAPRGTRSLRRPSTHRRPYAGAELSSGKQRIHSSTPKLKPKKRRGFRRVSDRRLNHVRSASGGEPGLVSGSDGRRCQTH